MQAGTRRLWAALRGRGQCGERELQHDVLVLLGVHVAQAHLECALRLELALRRAPLEHCVRAVHVCNGYPRRRREEQRHVLRDHRHQTAQAVGEGERDRLHVREVVVQPVGCAGERAQHVFVVVAAKAKGEDRHGRARHHGALHGGDDAGAVDDAGVGDAVGEEKHGPRAAAGLGRSAAGQRRSGVMQQVYPLHQPAAQVAGGGAVLELVDGLDRLALAAAVHRAQRQTSLDGAIKAHDRKRIARLETFAHQEAKSLLHRGDLGTAHRAGTVDNGDNFHRQPRHRPQPQPEPEPEPDVLRRLQRDHRERRVRLSSTECGLLGGRGEQQRSRIVSRRELNHRWSVVHVAATSVVHVAAEAEDCVDCVH
eukprot:scaffold38308_cov67-Phaeocystis_antarctica.AAC.4